MKRVLVTCFAVLMMCLLMPSTAKAASERVTLSVTADKATANPGDTVNFEVKLGAVEKLGGLDFTVSIPAGLTIVPDSIAVQDGLEDILKSDGKIIRPVAANNWNWCYSVGEEGYTGASELSILSFSCTVDAGAVFEEKTVTLEMKQCFDDSPQIVDIAVDLVPAALTVEKAVIHVSDVTLDQTSLTLKDGATAKLTAVVVPSNAENPAISWSSNNTAAATVAADGTVTAVAAGTAVITVTAEDGGKTASCTVTVNCSHSMTKTEAVEATCETDGNVEYWSCSKCGRKYADEAGAEELTEVVRTKGHVYDNDEDSDCNRCGYKRFYVVISGAGVVYERDSEAGLTIIADGEYGLFQSVEVDGNLVDKANYVVSEGSTVVTLTKAYMDTLPAGEHIIRILYTDGKAASAQFTVHEEDDDDDDSNNNGTNVNTDDTKKVVSPKTGDTSRTEYPALAAAVCAAGIAAFLVYIKKKSYK